MEHAFCDCQRAKKPRMRMFDLWTKCMESPEFHLPIKSSLMLL
jgi:hypothetical protein